MPARTATEADLDAAVDAVVAAFWSYSESVHLLPREGARRRALPRFLRATLADSLAAGTLFVAEAGGTVVGAAAWLAPGAYPIPLRPQVGQLLHLAPAAPWAWRAAIEGRRGRAAVRADHRPKPPHWFLRSLGVRPDAQASGAGSALVRPCLDRADDDGVGCYLTTASEPNVAWYSRFGFEVTATFRPTPTWPLVWSMWRDPR